MIIKHVVTMASGREHTVDLEGKGVFAVDTLARNLRQEKPGSIDMTIHTFVCGDTRFVLNINHIESIVPLV